MRYRQSGFTIVELLIVIVVIAILAAISIVAYRGIQERSKITTIKSDLAQMSKAIGAYRAIHGEYPIAASWTAQSSSNRDLFIPGVVPEVVSSLPGADDIGCNATYRYRSTGDDYKLLYLCNASTATLPDFALADSDVQRHLDPSRGNRGWGYWSSGGAGL